MLSTSRHRRPNAARKRAMPTVISVLVCWVRERKLEDGTEVAPTMLRIRATMVRISMRWTAARWSLVGLVLLML